MTDTKTSIHKSYFNDNKHITVESALCNKEQGAKIEQFIDETIDSLGGKLNDSIIRKIATLKQYKFEGQKGEIKTFIYHNIHKGKSPKDEHYEKVSAVIVVYGFDNDSLNDKLVQSLIYGANKDLIF